MTVIDLVDQAGALDAADPLADFRDHFIGSDDPEIIAYLDGNSLGRPLRATRDRISHFVNQTWGSRLIRAWDEGWMDDPVRIGDQIGRVALGAERGQTVVGDSTSVMLYKWIRAALASQPGRDEIIVDVGNFPTDRFVVEGIAAECGMRLRWLETDRRSGVTLDDVAEVISSRTALILLSDVAYRSGYLADVTAITKLAHDHDALVLWDVCHSVGVISLRLDDWRVDRPSAAPTNTSMADLAHLPLVMCVPIFSSVFGSRSRAGWGRPSRSRWPSITRRLMVSGAFSAARRRLSGCWPCRTCWRSSNKQVSRRFGPSRSPSPSSRCRSPISCSSRWASRWAHLATQRGAVATSHCEHPEFRATTAQLWELGVIPDFRPPDGLRIGLSPLSTSFGEVHRGLAVAREVLWQLAS